MYNPFLFFLTDPLIIRTAIQIIAILTIVFLLYLRGSGSKEFCFSYVAIGLIVFALCTLLEQVKLELGFALGLFAIFGIIRYRTITIPIKEMTYLFIVIGISVINALASNAISTSILAISNVSIILCLAGLEVFILRNRSHSILMRYERVENLQTKRKPYLINDLRDRLGISVTHFDIEEVDFLRDTANLRVYYTEQPNSWEEKHVSDTSDSIVFDRK